MRTFLIIVSSLSVAVGIAACGGSSSSSSSASSASAGGPYSPAPASSSSSPAAAQGHIIDISANPGGMLMFSNSSLHTSAGKVTIRFTNRAPEEHNLTLQSSGGTTLAATPTFTGGTKTLVVTLKAGTYTYFCSVPGHRAGGMQGTLTVS